MTEAPIDGEFRGSENTPDPQPAKKPNGKPRPKKLWLENPLGVKKGKEKRPGGSTTSLQTIC